MICKTRGIVLHRLKYSDSSLIARIYTEQFGLCSFLVQGARKKTSSVKANLLQPLSLVELVAYHKESTGLQKMKEIKSDYPMISVHDNLPKTTIALFLSEILMRSIREESPNKPLFAFLHSSLIFFDRVENPANFHLLFLVKLSKFLGFFPHLPPAENGLEEPVELYNSAPPGEKLFFNLTEGIFEKEKPAHSYHIEPEHSGLFKKLIRMDFDALSHFTMESKSRKLLLEKIIDYYRLHIAGFQDIKSYHVLETVLRN